MLYNIRYYKDSDKRRTLGRRSWILSDRASSVQAVPELIAGLHTPRRFLLVEDRLKRVRNHAEMVQVVPGPIAGLHTPRSFLLVEDPLKRPARSLGVQSTGFPRQARVSHARDFSFVQGHLAKPAKIFQLAVMMVDPFTTLSC